MHIEIATENDLQEILDLQYLAYQSEAELVGTKNIQPLTQTLPELREEFQNGLILKATDGGKIIGSIRGYARNQTLHIGKLMVHPDFQNKGIGSALLLTIETHYPDYRYELFTSSMSEKNIAIYQKNGYREFKREPFYNDLLFVYLEK